jgi:proline dehydrogenase
MPMHTGSVLAGILPLVPKPVVWAVARRYIAGETLADALRVTRDLEARGRLATLDLLGEQLTGREAVLAMVRAYEMALVELQRAHPTATLSVMMTGFGLRLDAAFCWDNLRRLAVGAADRRIPLTLNMEDSTTVDATLDIYRRLRAEGHSNVGIVLQSCLRRTLEDVATLTSLRPRVRIVKGIWRESSDVAYLDADEIRASYIATLEALLAADDYVEVATHDDALLDRALALVRGRDAMTYEFQMLLGVRPSRGDTLVASGHRVRVYVPYGKDWHAYSLRRLRENPEMAQHVARDLVRAVRRRSVSA